MKNKFAITPEEQSLFQQATKGVKPLKQTGVLPIPRPLLPESKRQQHYIKQQEAAFYFSDHYQPLLEMDNVIRYCRSDVANVELKKLCRGDYQPELFLDLHGLTQAQAKREIAALLVACRHERVACVCIMHGHGKHILKKQVPFWLAQHPDIMAFHQAPKHCGGNAALLVLVELMETTGFPATP